MLTFLFLAIFYTAREECLVYFFLNLHVLLFKSNKSEYRLAWTTGNLRVLWFVKDILKSEPCVFEQTVGDSRVRSDMTQCFRFFSPPEKQRLYLKKITRNVRARVYLSGAL